MLEKKLERRKNKMAKNKYTGDLFGVEDCPNCNGSGTVIEKYIFNEFFPSPISEHEEDCDICNGSGIVEE